MSIYYFDTSAHVKYYVTAAALEGLHTNNPFDHIMPEDTSSSSP